MVFLFSVIYHKHVKFFKANKLFIDYKENLKTNEWVINNQIDNWMFFNNLDNTTLHKIRMTTTTEVDAWRLMLVLEVIRFKVGDLNKKEELLVLG